MSEKAAFTASELLAVMSGRLLQDGQTVFAGVGIPLLAVTLAQRMHGPGITILFEGGTLGRSKQYAIACRVRTSSNIGGLSLRLIPLSYAAGLMPKLICSQVVVWL